MTQEEITKQLQFEWSEFSRKPFPNIIPEWFIVKFREIVMEVPQQQLKYRSDQLQSIISKQSHELSIDEVGMMCNAYLDVRPKFISPKLEVFIQKRIQIDSIASQVKELEAQEIERLKRREHALTKMIPPAKRIIQA